MFKIGEFSKLTRVSVRMLRYYDEMGLLKPEKVDPWTGYRMYSAGQIPVLNKIIYLRDSGFLVAEIADALAGDEGYIIEQLDRKKAEIEHMLREEQERLQKIELAKKELLYEKSELHYQVSIKAVPACRVLSLRRRIPDYYGEGRLWEELSAFAARQRIAVSNETFSIYHDTEYKETDVDVEVCAPAEKQGESSGEFVYRTTGAVPFMASAMVYGPFSNIAGAYLTLAEWLQKNSGYKMTGQSRQIVHRGPWNEENPQEYLVEIQIPLDVDSHTVL